MERKEINTVPSGAVKKRQVYIDFLRIIACYFVIFAHTPAYSMFVEEQYNAKLWIHLFFLMFTRFSVLMFFMIPGVVLLKKDEPISAIFTKRIPRVLAALFVGCITIYIQNQINYGGGSVMDFVRSFISGTVYNAWMYWFLYTYMGLLIMLPFLRAIVKNLSEKEYKYLLILRIVFISVVPIVSYILPGIKLYSEVFAPIAIVDTIFYVLMGYWLGVVFDLNKLNTIKCVIIGAISVICLFIACLVTVLRDQSGAYTEDYIHLFDYAIALAIFIIARYFFDKVTIPAKLEQILTYLGGLTLGVYIFDPIMKPYIRGVFDFESIGVFNGGFVYSFVSVIVCMCVTAILKKLPVFRKIF